LGYEEKVDVPGHKLFSARIVEAGRFRFDWIVPNSKDFSNIFIFISFPNFQRPP